MNASTEPLSVPATPPPDGEAPVSPSHRRRWWFGGAALVLLAAGILAAFTVRIPYYEFRPGSARPVAPLVDASGTKTYPPDSDIAFTTVSLRQSTLASYIWAQFDGDIDVVDENLVLGNRSPSENRQFNLQLMDTSKQDAIRDALLALGYEVPVTIDGVVVVKVEPGSPADGQLQVGDTIVSIDGHHLDTVDALSAALEGKGPGTPVTLEVEPPDRSATRTISLVLAPRPDDASAGFIGVNLQPRNPVYQFPFPVDIDSGNVGGPSAGLAFTLGVIDLLSPGELTGGHEVAVTGTIDAAGNVGRVGGVPQKTAAVVHGGYDVFLVPSSEVAEARQRAGNDLRIIGVDTLSDALDALASLGGSGLGSTPSGNSQPG